MTSLDCESNGTAFACSYTLSSLSLTDLVDAHCNDVIFHYHRSMSFPVSGPHPSAVPLPHHRHLLTCAGNHCVHALAGMDHRDGKACSDASACTVRIQVLWGTADMMDTVV